MNKQTKLPTLIAILRDLYGFMGIKIEHQKDGLAKKLDDFAYEVHSPHYLEDEAIDRLYPIGFSEKTQRQFVTLMKYHVFDLYRKEIQETRIVFGLNEDVFLNLYWQCILIPGIKNVISMIFEANKISQPWTDTNYLQSSVQFLREQSVDFQKRWEALINEDKNYVRRWGNQDALPNITKIREYFLNCTEISISSEAVKNFEILCFARLLQALENQYGHKDKKTFNEEVEICWNSNLINKKEITDEYLEVMRTSPMTVMIMLPFGSEFGAIFFEDVEELYEHSVKMTYKSFSHTFGNQIVQKKFFYMFDELYQKMQKSSVLYNHAAYVLWQKARFLFYAHDYTQAISLYAQVLEQLLYKDMRYIERLIEEALIVSCIEKKSDKFITKLANLAIKLQVKLPVLDSLMSEVPKRLGKNHVFQSWEKEALLLHLQQSFELEFFADKSKIINLFPKRNYLSVSIDVEPDYKNPNKTMFFDMERRRKRNQLLNFISLGKMDVIEKLIANGADINAQTENNETALIFSLPDTDYCNRASPEIYENIFQLLIKQNISVENLNAVTKKMKKSALGQAIRWVKPSFVKALLEKGANPNIVGIRGQTPLYQSLQILHSMKKTKNGLVKKDIHHQMDNVYMKDHLYKTHVGLGNEHLEKIKKSEYFRFIEDFFRNNTEYQYGSVEDVHEIILALLEAGANPNNNASEFPIAGYTPLMLAVELNEAEIVEAMLNHGGDLEQYYIDYRNGNIEDLKNIAGAFKSVESLAVLEKFEISNQSSDLN